MALVTINDVRVLSGTIMMPLVGVWTADLVIDQIDGTGFDAGSSVVIKADGGVELVGSVADDRTGTFLDSVHVRVLGGAGGMGDYVSPRAYVQPGAYVRDALGGIVDPVGETLSSDISQALLRTNLTAWAIMRVPAVQALLALIDIVNPALHWRILPDGTLWIGEETWPTASYEFQILESNPTDKVYLLGVDSPAIVPGKTVDGIGLVNRVEHSIESGRIRSRVWTDIGAEERGIRGAVSAIVRQEIAGIDYYTLYDCTVQSQSADGTTVDLQPVDKRLPGMSRVPVRWGLPGCVAKFVPAGAVMRLGWDRGNPQFPYACLPNGGATVTALQLAGNTYSALTTSTFLSAVSQALATILATNGGGPILSDGGTAITTLITQIAAGSYNSQKVKYG